MHPDAWQRFTRAAECVGFPAPPVLETLSQRFRKSTDCGSTGNFINNAGKSEAFSSVFVASLQLPTPFAGRRFEEFGLCLLHGGIVVFGPMLTRERPCAYLIAIDTRHALPSAAAHEVARFLNAHDTQAEVPYSQSWARRVPRASWTVMSERIRQDIRKFSEIET
jgi:hypothetical protein